MRLVSLCLMLTLSAQASQHFLYFEAENADPQESIAYRDEGFTSWMGHPSNGRTVIFAGTEGNLSFRLDNLPHAGPWYVHVRQLAFAAPLASVEVLADGVSLGITEFPQPGTYLAWSEALGPFEKRDGTALTLRLAESNGQAPYVDVVLVTDQEDFIADNMDQDYEDLVLREAEGLFHVTAYAVADLGEGLDGAAATGVHLGFKNLQREPLSLSFLSSATDPVHRTRSSFEQEAAIAGDGSVALWAPLPMAIGQAHVVRTQLCNAAGETLFLRTESVTPKKALTVTPSARWLSPGETLDVSVRVFGTPDTPLPLTIDLDGQTLVSHEAPSGETIVLVVPLEGIGLGAHVIAVRVADRTEHFKVHLIPWPSETLPDIERVSIEGRIILVNGSPFIPRKLHHVNASALVKRQGYNAVDCWGGDSLEGVEHMLDEAHASNLYGYGVLFHPHFYKGIDKGFDLDALRAGVTRLRRHPALLLWELYDEPDAGVPVEQLVEAYRLVRQLDPNHPVVLNFCFPDRFREYAVAADMVSMDVYPVPTHPVTRVSAYMDRLLESVDRAKPCQAVLQAYGNIKGRMPTPRELRCMAYLAINHGATSTAFYSYQEPGEYPFCLAADPILWSYTRQLNAELLALTDVIIAPEAESVARASVESIDLSTRQVGDALVVIAVNTQPMPVAADIEIPGRFSGTEGLQGTGDATPDQRDQITRFSTRFQPYDVKIYRLSGRP